MYIRRKMGVSYLAMMPQTKVKMTVAQPTTIETRAKM
jgi:hypothetical protein